MWTSNPQMVGHGFWGVANRTTWLFKVRHQSCGNEGAERVFEEERGRNDAAVVVMAKRQGEDSAWLLKSSRMGQSRWLGLESDQRHMDAGHMVRTEHTQEIHTAQGWGHAQKHRRFGLLCSFPRLQHMPSLHWALSFSCFTFHASSHPPPFHSPTLDRIIFQ
jgi:hypothetical protein